jgi:hypothetical protein
MHDSATKQGCPFSTTDGLRPIVWWESQLQGRRGENLNDDRSDVLSPSIIIIDLSLTSISSFLAAIFLDQMVCFFK